MAVMMTKEELAAQLKGNQYGDEISEDLAREAKNSGLVVVFGASDDLMELRGALHDETGGGAYVTPLGLFNELECDSECKYYRAAKAEAVEIEALWGKDGWSWQYKTDIPHATFEIFEDEEKYCKGIVFALSDVKPNS
jgi:hypothetical protein